ncbi:hypothetical protein [Methylocystis echinoides]|uniref:hypothetical protein n=1 Tax=Methylocystis echinoides TaxID=29468 RepID=UPI003431606C
MSASGLKQQDNDILVVREPSVANAFEARFEQIWAGSNPLPAPGNQRESSAFAHAEDGNVRRPHIRGARWMSGRKGGSPLQIQ